MSDNMDEPFDNSKLMEWAENRYLLPRELVDLADSITHIAESKEDLYLLAALLVDNDEPSAVMLANGIKEARKYL